MKRIVTTLFVLAFGLGASAATAQLQGLYIYPQKGQSKEKQSADESECSRWATEQTGYDPLRAGAPQAPADTGGSAARGAVGGAAKGAAIGAIGGAIAGDAGKGAAIGAGVGGAGGLMRGKGKQREAQRQQEAAVAGEQQRQGEFRRAFSTCMEGRGYTVN